MKNTTVLKRNEVPEHLTWNLNSIFPTLDRWEDTFQTIEKLNLEAGQFQGKLSEKAETLLEALNFRNDLLQKIETLYTYAHLLSDQDTAESQAQALQSRARSLYSKVASAISYYETELLEADEAALRSYLNHPDLQIYTHEFDLMFERRQYILSDKEELLLAKAGDVLSGSSETFGVLNNADLRFKPLITKEGEELQLSHGRYGLYLENTDRDLRKQAFKNMYASYQDLKNTFAATLSNTVKRHNFNAAIRGFKSAREAALFANHIPENVYESLVDAIHTKIDLLHQYVDLRKDILKLDEIRMYDVYLPMVEDVTLEFTYEEAQEIILEALQVLGDDYVSVLKKAFQERWIDVMENEGKRSGAYSSGCYTTNPYILLNWQDNLDNLYTLAHELGHSLHSYYTRKHQPFIYGDYSIFVAEVASTTNENLLTAYLLKKYNDPKIQAYIINHYLDGVKGTVYRQTQFAEFEHLIHQSAQNGIALTQEYLSKEYDRINRFYYGETMTYDPEIQYEWARIPHFYYNYYVYQYATGFSAASALSHKLLTEGQSAVTNYLKFLQAGSSVKPIDALRIAGVDMTSNQATLDALSVFEERLAQLKTLI
ncbi:MAG TPA: oligoendopeptidase F [Erysipelotrichaceae bacterium]|nr:oligoendopeptidase F [Erysipelotrichaceae bacterium]